MMAPIRLACVVAVVVLPASARAQRGELAGCYDVTIGEWSPAPDPDALYATMPPRIELVDTPATDPWRNGRRAARPAPGVMPSVHRMAYWSSRASDTVDIVWTTGFSGVRLLLKRTPAALEGTARAFTDVIGPPVPQASATARRVSCDAPLPDEWRYRYAHGRGFLLSTGDSLVLGAPLPVGVTGDSVGNGGLMLDILPVDVLAGATSLDVGLETDGIVRAIRASYPAETRLQDLVQRMETVWGPAATVWADTSAAGVVRSGAEWNDPLIMKRLGRNTMGDGSIEVVVYMAARQVIRGRPHPIR